MPRFSTWCVKIRDIADFFSLCFLGLSIKFPSPFFFSLHYTFRWKHLDRRELSLNNNLSCSTFSKTQALLVTEDLVKVCLASFLTANNNPSPSANEKQPQPPPNSCPDMSYRNTTIVEMHEWETQQFWRSISDIFAKLRFLFTVTCTNTALISFWTWALSTLDAQLL